MAGEARLELTTFGSMAGEARLELTTFGFGDRRSTN